MKFESVIKEAMVDLTTYKLAKNAIQRYKTKNPKKIVDKMIQDAGSEHKKNLLQSRRKEIMQAIPHILKH